MSEHHRQRTLGDVPGHRAVELAPPKFVHISKELHIEPIIEMRLDAYGKSVPQTVGYKFVLHHGDGKTFKKPGTRRYIPQSNDWGAEPYKVHRERSDAAYLVRLAQMSAAAELV